MPLVLLHGFCETKSVWKELVDELSENYLVIVPDMPGFGDNEEKVEGITMSKMAVYLKALLDELKIQECVLIGHSMGGYVSLEFAQKYPDMVMGLGLIHSTAYADTEERKQNRNKTIEFVEKNGVAPFIETFIPNLFAPSFKDDLKDEIDFATNVALTTPKQTIVEVTKALRDREDHTATLKEIACPVLFIFGKEDSILPLEQHLPITAMPNYSMVNVLGYTGHMAMLELPGETMYFISVFMDFIENA